MVGGISHSVRYSSVLIGIHDHVMHDFSDEEV